MAEKRGDGSKGGAKAKAKQHAPRVADPRFARLHTDPRFLKPKKDDTKIVVDQRFKALFDGDERGRKRNKERKAKVDRYGRPISATAEQAQLRRFYRLEDDEEGEGEGDDGPSDVESEPTEGSGAKFVDYARGQALLESSGDEEEEDYEGEDQEGSESESGAEDSSELDSEIELGDSNARARAAAQRAQEAADVEESEEEGEEDYGDLNIDLDENAGTLAALDAQAAEAIKAGQRAAEKAAAARAKAAAKAGKEKALKKRRKGKAVEDEDEEEDGPPVNPTNRIAAVNMDWDNVRAKDIYKVFSSLVSPTARQGANASVDAGPSTIHSSSRTDGAGSAVPQVRGQVLSVRVYPSEFGKERMEREEREGPPKEIFKGQSAGARKKKLAIGDKKGKGKASDDMGEDEDEEDSEVDDEELRKAVVQVDEGEEFDEKALRTYQLERLRYFYAIATFDTAETAAHVYQEVNGSEMERTANFFDLSYVPEDMEFDQEWRDEATEDTGNYKAIDFKTDALRHSRVKLTWDGDDPERQRVTRQLLTEKELDDDDFKPYLASSGSESEPEGGDDAEAGSNGAGSATEKHGKSDRRKAAERDRLRALLGLDDDGNIRDGGEDFFDSRPKGEMSITFTPGLSEAAARKAAKEGKEEEEEENETTLEKYLRKKKEKKEAKKLKKIEKEEGVAGTEMMNGVGVASVDGEVGFDDAFFDEEPNMEAALAEHDGGGRGGTGEGKKKGKGDEGDKKKKKNKKLSREEREARDRERAELALLVGDGGEGSGGGGAKGQEHFNMSDVIKAEKAAALGRKAKARLRGKKGRMAEERENETQDGFRIDVADARFAALHEDHQFAIDPSNPHFIKTKAMSSLIEESQKRRTARSKALGGGEGARGALTEGAGGRGKGGDGDGDGDGLAALVRNIKKRSAEGVEGGMGKRKKT